MSQRGRGRPRPAAVGLVAVATGALVVLTAGPAAAHVLIESVEPRGDGTVLITFTFDHGCDGEPTDSLRVTLPDGVEALGTQEPSGWAADVTPAQVSWTGGSVPDGERAAFELEARVEGEAGQAFVFPTEQECASGDGYSWTGSDPGSEYPAPTFVATAATLAPSEASDAPSATDTSSSGFAPLVGGFVVLAGAAGAAGGWYSRRRGRDIAV